MQVRQQKTGSFLRDIFGNWKLSLWFTDVKPLLGIAQERAIEEADILEMQEIDTLLSSPEHYPSYQDALPILRKDVFRCII